MKTGRVKFFIESKGYGFITDDESGKDIFVHATDINTAPLKEGDKVEYTTGSGRKGEVAKNVSKIEA